MIAKEPEDTMITAKLHYVLNTFFLNNPFLHSLTPRGD